MVCRNGSDGVPAPGVTEVVVGVPAATETLYQTEPTVLPAVCEAVLSWPWMAVVRVAAVTPGSSARCRRRPSRW